MNIAVLSNINLEPMGRFLKRDFEEVYFCGFNQYMLELIDGNSTLNKKSFDVVLLHLDGEELLKKYFATIHRFVDLNDNLQSDIDPLLDAITSFLAKNEKTLVIMNTIAVPPYNFNTYLDANSEYSFRKINNYVNDAFINFANGFSNLIIMDWEKVLNFRGYASLYDEKYFYLGRIKYTNLAFEEIRKETTNLVKAYRGKARKVLVLDLDNTLWGGIIGEDGIDGIKLSEDGEGKAYRDFQGVLKSTKEVGVILAVCSKNNYEDVKECFEKHPMGVLKLDDFVSVKVNWENKIINIREMAQELNLGLDSFVFIDDNPVEREFVKNNITEVAVPDFPEDPTRLKRWFIEEVLYEYFPKMHLTDEDRTKTVQYQANVKRKKSAEKLDLDDFIKSLDISLDIHIDDRKIMERTAQLTQKTNQFNLTTKRYTKKDIENFMSSPDYSVFSLGYRDKFNDEGIIGAAIVKIENDTAIIDTFLMSCRVVGRKVEYGFFSDILGHISDKYSNVKIVCAEYIPTKKNNVASDFYDKCGLDPRGRGRKSVSYESSIRVLLERLGKVKVPYK